MYIHVPMGVMLAIYACITVLGQIRPVSWGSGSTKDLLRFSSTRRSPGRTLVVSVVMFRIDIS